MSRLIDADILFAELNEKEIPWNRRINDIIMNQPTAYDVDKVVEKLEEFREEMKQFGCESILTDIIEVVKGGGVDG